MTSLNIVAMYRVKNEERWIKKSLESIFELCSKIVVLDDGSTDDNYVRKFKKVKSNKKA